MSESKSMLEITTSQAASASSSPIPGAPSFMPIPMSPIIQGGGRDDKRLRSPRSPLRSFRPNIDRSGDEQMVLPSPAVGGEKTILIAGAGVGGCFTALELAEMKTPEGSPKYQIILIDKNSDILRGSSDITPGRMGLGFHYVHEATAIMYLRSTIEFQKEWSREKDFRIGSDLPAGSPERHALQHGWYFIVKSEGQGVTAKEILKTYSALKKEYARLVAEDPTNKVFGEPEDFFRILDPKEYENDVVMDKVELGIETAECLLDWKAFRKFLINKLTQHDNIHITIDTTVEKITHNKKTYDYSVETSRDIGTGKESHIHRVDAVVNCTWENARALNATAGLIRPDKRTNRLKALIIVALPASFKTRHSAFFCMGPHAMFSNLGNGVGAMTFAPETSMISSTALQVPDEINKYLSGSATLEEKFKKAQDIRRGVAIYLRGIEEIDEKENSEKKVRGLEIKEIRFGIVQTHGDVDIFDHKSAFSRRDYNGISEELLGLLTNACMKLFYGPENGKIAKDIINGHLEEVTAIKKFHTSLNKFSESKDSSNKVREDDLDLSRYAKSCPHLKTQVRFFDKSRLKHIAPTEETASGRMVVATTKKEHSSVSRGALPTAVVAETKGTTIAANIAGVPSSSVSSGSSATQEFANQNVDNQPSQTSIFKV